MSSMCVQLFTAFELGVIPGYNKIMYLGKCHKHLFEFFILFTLIIRPYNEMSWLKNEQTNI